MFSGRAIFWWPTLFKVLSLFPEALSSATFWNSVLEMQVLKFTSSSMSGSYSRSFILDIRLVSSTFTLIDKENLFFSKLTHSPGWWIRQTWWRKTLFACNSILELSAKDEVFHQFSSASPTCDDTFHDHFQQLPCPSQLSAMEASTGINFAPDVQVSSFRFLLWKGNGVPPSLSSGGKKNFLPWVPPLQCLS